MFLLLVPCKGKAQEKRKVFLPLKSVLTVRTNIHWNLEKSFGDDEWDNVIQELQFQYRLFFTEKIHLSVRNELDLRGDEAQNSITQFKLIYRNRFQFENNKGLFRHGIQSYFDIGRLQWRPRFTNLQLILENADLFFNPIEFWGASTDIRIPFFKQQLLKFRFRARSGDLLFQDDIDPLVQDTYFTLQKFHKKVIGLEAQFGKAQGSQHLINFAHITLRPKWEDLQFTFKLGKLPSYDESPYGIHIGLRREFTYIALGGFYERRIEQQTEDNIAGFYWNIIGPPKVVEVVRAFQFSYSFNTNSIIVFIPFVKVNIQHKKPSKP